MHSLNCTVVKDEGKLRIHIDHRNDGSTSPSTNVEAAWAPGGGVAFQAGK